MQLIRRPGPRAPLPACAATIGVFDGLHRGHQQLISRVRQVAAASGWRSLVFSFEPTPAEAMGGNPPARLMSLREKAAFLSQMGVDALYCPPFDAAMEAMSPAQFIEQILRQTLNVRYVLVGDDFRFGHRRAGDFPQLAAAARAGDFQAEQLPTVEDGGHRVSSSRIRQALEAGQMADAAAMLGRPYSMTGRVIRGQQLGRRLGFPTANLRLGRQRCAVHGIFAVRVRGIESGSMPGVASLGTRPAVGGGEPLLEVHLFDFQGNLYGRCIQVDFIARLRCEAHFPDLESLTAQMVRDGAAARALLGNSGTAR
jgi:riboflavin kinase / FMN adenylyltransferase